MFIFVISAQCQLFGMSPADHALLDSAVKQIVHPAATATSEMINVANAQGGPPSTMQDLMAYVPHLQSLARQMGVKPPGTKGAVTPQILDQFILNRAMQWQQQYNMRSGGASGGMFGGNNGRWLMRMMLFDQFF